MQAMVSGGSRGNQGWRGGGGFLATTYLKTNCLNSALIYPDIGICHSTIYSAAASKLPSFISSEGGGPRVVVSTAAFHARVRGSVPGLGGLKETKLFLPHPRVKVSIVGSLRDREVACSASDRQGSNFESCVWRTVSSQSSHHPQEVLLAQFSLYVHKGGLKPDSFHLLARKTKKHCLTYPFLCEAEQIPTRPKISNCEKTSLHVREYRLQYFLSIHIATGQNKGTRRMYITYR